MCVMSLCGRVPSMVALAFNGSVIKVQVLLTRGTQFVTVLQEAVFQGDNGHVCLFVYFMLSKRE